MLLVETQVEYAVYDDEAEFAQPRNEKAHETRRLKVLYHQLKTDTRNIYMKYTQFSTKIKQNFKFHTKL